MTIFHVTWKNRLVVNCLPEAEKELKSVLLRKGEDCRGIELPEERVAEIRKECQNVGMEIEQAMSLRRHYKKLEAYRQHGFMIPVDQIGIGTEAKQKQHADKIEAAMAFTLDTLKIPYTRNQPPNRGPDFMLHGHVYINDREVKWIEVKSFYACASLTSRKLGVGRVPDIAKRYQNEYGPGCIAFSCGFHQAFANSLHAKASDVTLLDCSKETLDTVLVEHE